MRIRPVVAGLCLAASACNPHVDIVQTQPVVVARFDPGAATPVVPTPTDLVEDEATGLLNVPVPAEATEADRAFVAYLNTLNGYPGVSSATATFSGALDPAKVSADSVKVIDLTDGNAPVQGATLQYVDQPEEAAAKGRVLIRGPERGTWLPGHRYAVALLGGERGLRGERGEAVVGSAAWLLLRSEKPLVTCEDLTSADCRATTDLIPSKETDPALRLEDQARTAVRLEEVRRHYAPVFQAFVDAGVARRDIALMWSFRIHDRPTVVFAPSATPARVPTPTDLAIDGQTGLVAAPIDPSASPAEQEFLRDYLNTLTGWPASSTAAVEIDGGEVDAATVTAESVRLYDLTAEGQPPVTDATLAWDSTKKRIVYAPPQSGWNKGHTYAVAVIAAPEGGLRMADGRIPIGTETWELLRLKVPLATCAEGDPESCQSNLAVAGVSASDAKRLEAIRLDYAPLLEKLEGEGIDRSSVAVVWKFSIAANPEATFDPAAGVVPFPNDLVRIPASGSRPAHVNLPIAADASDAARKLIENLNTLDGFSTTAVVVSENSAEKGVIDTGTLTEAALTGNVGFLALTDGAPSPKVKVCLDCTSRPPAENAPQQLQFVPEVPLQEGTTYGGYLTTGLKDADGRGVIPSAAFALMRSSHPLVTDDGQHSAVSVLSDDQAMALEAARLTLKPMLDRLEAQGIARKQVTLAFNFTTQTTRATLGQLAALPFRADLASKLPVAVAALNDGLDTVLRTNQNPFPYSNVGKFYISRLTLPDVLTPEGPDAPALNLTTPGAKEVPFLLTIPSTAAPASGYPVVLFGHPITSTRLAALGLADKLAAAGFAMLVIDLPLHGDRATCTGSKDSLALQQRGATSDNAACTTGSTCSANGRCTSGAGLVCNLPALPGQPTGDSLCFINDQGLCAANGRCEGGTFLENPDTSAPYISGWNFIASDFFATRANLLQSVVDVSQLVRVISASGTNTLNARLGTKKLDPNAIHYVGMSLGGISGALATSAVPAVQRVVINAAGADLLGILLDGLTPEARQAFLDKLAAADPTLVPGAPQFEQFVNILRWALDASDAANQAPSLISPEQGAARQVYFQYIEGDLVVPNANTEKLIASANRSETPSAAVTLHTAPSSVTGSDRHGYLVTGAYSSLPANDPLKQVCTQAQTQLVNFLRTGNPDQQ